MLSVSESNDTQKIVPSVYGEDGKQNFLGNFREITLIAQPYYRGLGLVCKTPLASCSCGRRDQPGRDYAVSFATQRQCVIDWLRCDLCLSPAQDATDHHQDKAGHERV